MQSLSIEWRYKVNSVSFFFASFCIKPSSQIEFLLGYFHHSNFSLFFTFPWSLHISELNHILNTLQSNWKLRWTSNSCTHPNVANIVRRHSHEQYQKYHPSTLKSFSTCRVEANPRNPNGLPFWLLTIRKSSSFQNLDLNWEGREIINYNFPITYWYKFKILVTHEPKGLEHNSNEQSSNMKRSIQNFQYKKQWNI